MTFNFSGKLSHQEKIAAARGLARKRMPYFSSALFALMPRPMAGMFDKMKVAMAVTPKGIMYYDPEVVENAWDIEDVEFGMLHEVSHFLRDHAKRREDGGYDPKTWNSASDAAINDDLLEAGMKAQASDMVPRKILHPQTQQPMANGMTEEAYYDAIRQMKDPPSGENPDGSPPRPGCGCCGGAAGNPLDDLPDDGTSTEATGGRSEVDLERVKKEVAKDIQKHAENHGAGSIPGGWKVWSDQQLTPPVVRWQDYLAQALRNGLQKVRGMINFHYSRPSRRQQAVGGWAKGTPILPSMYATLPRVGLFVDTSGSMGAEDLQICMSEAGGILKTSQAEVLLGVCDAQMHGEIRPVKSIEEAITRLEGGGGTDFVPVYEELKKMPPDKRPHIVVFATDGGGPAPAANPLPDVHTIWLLVGDHAEVPWCAAPDGTWTYGGQRIDWGTQIFVKNPSGRESAKDALR